MKTDREWLREYAEKEDGIGVDGPSEQFTLAFIRAIQSDAIYHASEFVGEMPKKYDRMRAWYGPYRAACVFARSHLRELAADLLVGSKE